VHLAHPRPNRSTCSRRVRGPLGVLIASIVLLASAIGPVAAASPAAATTTKSSSHGPTREVTKGHIASANAAGKAAIGNPRNGAVKDLPFRTVAIAHPAKTSGFQPKQAARLVSPRIVSGPDVQVATQFAGLNEGSGGGWVPPDPWVAVSGTYVVQSVNSMVRVSNRQGTEISSIPSWALFGLSVGQFSSDDRILWDATHGRWVASSLSFNDSLTNNELALAVSDGADPTAGWSTYLIRFADKLPDYPSLASSADKIVIADDLFDGVSPYPYMDINTFTWASILAGGALTYNHCDPDLNLMHPRAAQVLSPSGDVHLIMESSFDGSQWYARVKGAGACTSTSFVDKTQLALDALVLPPDPRQSPGTTIGVGGAAVDERPTDAVWQNNKLWWVSTIPVSYDAGATQNDGVALWSATTATTGVPTAATMQAVTPGDGIDAFMGGIGLTRNGTLVTIYSQSSNTELVSMRANQIAPGLSLGTPITLDTGNATYTADRWGDYAGVAMDPTGTGSVWATHEVADADGNWRTQVVRLVADDDLPTNPGRPSARILAPAGLSVRTAPVRVTVPVRISWTPATDTKSGNVTYQMAESIDGGGFYEISTLSTTSIVRQQLVGHTYDYLIGAIDAVGNESSGIFSPSLTPYLYQQNQSTTYGGTWSSSTSANYAGGSVKYASAAGKTATFTASSARSIAFITTKGPSRGSFKVYVDGVLKATVSAYSATTKYRQIVYQFNWASLGTHKIKIYVKGTSGHPRIDIDAWVVLR
jgi:hypothetical protein